MVYSGKSVSVVLPTYNEKDSIQATIRDFEALGIVDEILVVNNNAAAGTSEEVALTTAREVFEATQGYGAAIKRGLREASGDYVCICEPDGTFEARDIVKLLAYAEDVDIAYGSRTVHEFIWSGANMGFFLRFGNWSVAKLMEVLFNTNSLSDVGCTMRVARRSAIELILPHLTVDGSHFGPQMMCVSIIARLRIVQVPVNYHLRVGSSSVTGDLRVAAKLGVTMIGLILRYRFRSRGLRQALQRPA
jgi:glycosyltransferase involved in cell wall biosynthesis